jgi:hypothetical protein
MDVRLPDGTIIQNVPDGTTKADLTVKLKANGYDVSKLEAPSSQTSEAEPSHTAADYLRAAVSPLAGAYRGVKDVTDTAALLGAKGMDVLSPQGEGMPTRAQAIQDIIDRQQAQYEQNFGDLYAAKVSRVGGQVFGTLPLGGAMAAPLRASAEAAPALAPYLTPVAASLESGGFNTGLRPGAANTAVSALGGGATGAASAAATGEDPTIGGVVGGAIPVLARPVAAGAQELYGFTRNMLNPKNVALVQAAEGRGEDIINALRQNQQLVQGSAPTAAQAASDVSGTLYPALEAQITKTAPTAFAERAAEQRAARSASLGEVGQTPEALKTAIEERGKNAKVDFGAAGKQIVQGDDTLDALLQTPAMQDAIRRAKEIAANKQNAFTLQLGEPAKTIESKIVDPSSGRPVTMDVPATPTKVSINDLHTLKTALDDMMSGAPEVTGIGKNEIKAIGDVKRQLVDWMENTSDKYAAARAKFQKASGPINTMEVGQYLEGKLTPALDETAAQRANVYAEALRNAPQTIKNATGTPRFDSLEKILSSEDYAKVDAIRADLAREAKTNKLAQQGTRSGDILQNVEAPPLPNMMSRIASVANAVMKSVQGRIDKKVAMELATEFLNPGMAANALAKALRYEANVNAGQTALRNRIVGGAAAMRPAAVNALSPYDTQNALAGQ